MKLKKFFIIAGVFVMCAALVFLLSKTVQIKPGIRAKVKRVMSKIVKKPQTPVLIKGKDSIKKGPIVIRIHPAREKHRVSRLLYGANLIPKMESDCNMWDFISNTGITCFRYPGGGSPGWHWQTGAADFNPSIKNMPLGNINYLIKFCQKTNTELIMQVNIESGTPQEAAELVNYMNNQANLRVNYWELGNEAYGEWDKAYAAPEKYAHTIKLYSAAMKAVDPSIKIGADWGEKYYDKIRWDEIIIKNAADYIDFVSCHWYPNHVNKTHNYEGRIYPTPDEVMANAMEIPNMVKRLNDLIEKEAPHRRGKIEMTFLEWDGAWDAPPYDPPPYDQNIMQWSLANAIFYADCLGLFAESGVTVSTHYAFQECPFGLIRGYDPAEAPPGEQWDKVTIRPKAFAIELFSKHFGDIVIDSGVENSPSYYKPADWWPSSYAGDVPYVTCYASKFNYGNKLGVILINKHPQKDFEVTISIDETSEVEHACNSWVLTGPDLMSQNDGTPGRVKIKSMAPINISNKFNYTIPAHSVVAMEIE